MAFLSRRLFLAGAVGTVARPAFAQAPLILRPEIVGVDPRYAAYATVGNHVPGKAVSFRTQKSRVIVFGPSTAKSARLVVFSHGALADPSTYRGLIHHWVSHGFIVAAPVHDDAAIERGLTLRTSNAFGISEWNIPTLLEDNSAWQDRADACSACLDALPLISESAGAEVTSDRPIIVGHGYGAYVAQLLLGASVNDDKGKRLKLRDPRFFGGIFMSPQGAGVMGLHEDSWADFEAPSLSLIVEGDRDFGGQDVDRKSDAYRLSKPGYKHLAVFKGGSSNTFSGQSSATNREDAKLTEVIRAMTTAFLRSYGDYDTEAFDDIASGFFQRMSLGLVTEHRR